MGVFSFVKAGKKTFDTIKSVAPTVNKTKKDIALSKLAIQQQKTKASGAKLKQTLFESKNKDFKKDDFTFATSNKKTLSNTEKQKLKEGLYGGGSKVTKKATGGRVGRRFGSPNPRKTNVQKIKETFSPKKKNLSPKQMKIAKLAGDPKRIDAPDFKKLRNR
jgi:hypothetical protein